MGRKKPEAEPKGGNGNAAGSGGAPRRWPLQFVLAVGAAAGVVAAVIFLGRWGLEHLRGSDRYFVPFRAIECAAPAGMSREEFLDEVRYEAHLPERVGLLDEDLAERLRVSFGKHPWVEKVGNVTVVPPRTLRVEVAFRRPVLAVAHDGKLIAVDAKGVRLPKNATTDGLPVYPHEAAPPGKAGQRWGDKRVEEFSARFAAK